MSKQSVTIKVAGMSCSHCVNTVHNLAADERGVEKIEISLQEGTMKVTGSEKMNRDQIINAINLSGIYHAE